MTQINAVKKSALAVVGVVLAAAFVFVMSEGVRLCWDLQQQTNALATDDHRPANKIVCTPSHHCHVVRF